MGNSSSRPSKKKSLGDDLPLFQRTDTSQSSKSLRSLKSIRSRKSQTNSTPTTPNNGGLDNVLSYSNSKKNVNGSFSSQLKDNSDENIKRQSFNQDLHVKSPRSSSLNGELPPSMIQMEPKSPILRYSSSVNNINLNSNPTYYENALTDDDNDEGGVDSGEGNTGIRLSNSRRRSTSNQRRKSSNCNSITLNNLEAPISSPIQMSRSSSHSSSHSRKSLAGGDNSVYTTPMNSPGIIRQNGDDYFNQSDLHSDLHSYHGLSEYPQGVSHDTDDIPLDPDNLPKKKKQFKPIDIDDTIQKLLDAGYSGKRTRNLCLKNSEIAQICHMVREIFLSQPSLLELSPPVKIVGDVHGQYADLLRLFTKCGFPPSANYLFLGDYVDRGKQSLETILLLLCYKIKYPENFFLLRGNHECANVTRVYGFYDECKRRCNIRTWKLFVDTFNTLPLAAIVAGKIFCVHGGLSPVLNSMDEIRHVSRPTDVPDFGLINDLLWSDPTDSLNEWEDNERGVSYCYNKVAINKFLNKFGFDLVCRAHMVVEDGYEFFNDRSLVTVFSAPNYCGEFDNWGAVMSVSEGLLCSFELLDPLDSAALKQVMKKGRQERKLANHHQQLQE